MFIETKVLKKTKRYLKTSYNLADKNIVTIKKFKHMNDCLKILEFYGFFNYIIYGPTVLLHDIGKILNNNTTDHAKYGYEVLKKNFSNNPIILLPIKYHEKDLDWENLLKKDSSYMDCNRFKKYLIRKGCKLVRDIDIISNMEIIALKTSEPSLNNKINEDLITKLINGEIGNKEEIFNSYDEITYILCGINLISQKKSFNYIKKQNIIDLLKTRQMKMSEKSVVMTEKTINMYKFVSNNFSYKKWRKRRSVIFTIFNKSKRSRLFKIYKNYRTNLAKDNQKKCNCEILEKKINLCIAKNCFMKCKGCYNNFCQHEEVNYKSVKSFLKYAKSRGLNKVTLSGGDPLTRKDINHIIKMCYRLKLKINLDTTGVSFIKSHTLPNTQIKVKKFSNMKVLKMIELVGLPLDGSNDQIIKEFRTYDGNLFNETKKVLNLFDEKKINVCINTVLHKKNIKDIENIYKVIKTHTCVKKWQVFQYMPIGPLGSKNAEIFKITINDLEKAKSKIRQDKNINIKFKSAQEREHNYMLVKSDGTAYKVYLNNTIESFGNIKDKTSWNNILDNLN